MQAFRIKGGKKLKGDVRPQGAKNEALQIISYHKNEIFKKSRHFGKIRTSYLPKKIYHVAIHFKALFLIKTMVPISK